jgi:two-component system, cell cycle sensor histidine kinase and response regulator CckA
MGDPQRPAAVIAGLLAEGGVLAVVRTEAEAQRAIGYGADEVILVAEACGPAFDKVIERTTARARARFHRDLYLIDLVRKDDTSALALLATALGREIIEPLARAAEQSSELVQQLNGGQASSERAHAIAETVSGVARVVEQMTQLVGTDPTDEVVDLCEVTRDVTRSLESGVVPVAGFRVTVEERPCPVGIPRWQAAMVVASLVANSVESVTKRGGTARLVSVTLSRESDAVVLEVADDGVGMDDESRVHAADPFYTTDGTSHLGLGLPLVAARVRRAGGDVLIESDEGVGTTVRVFLPLVGGALESARSAGDTN